MHISEKTGNLQTLFQFPVQGRQNTGCQHKKSAFLKVWVESDGFYFVKHTSYRLIQLVSATYWNTILPKRYYAENF